MLENKKKILIISGIGLLAAYVIPILISIILRIIFPVYSASYDYEIDNYEDVSAKITYTEPAKDAVYEPGFNETFTYGSFTDTVLECGKEIPNGELTIKYHGTNPFGDSTIAEFQNVGAGSFEGKSLATKESFYCRDGKQVRLYNDDGEATITGNKKLVQAATPEKDVTEEVIQLYDNDTGGKTTQECKVDYEETDCTELKKYNELNEQIDTLAETQQSTSEVNEILEYDSLTKEETYYYNDMEVSKSDLLHYDDLKEKIDNQMD